MTEEELREYNRSEIKRKKAQLAEIIQRWANAGITATQIKLDLLAIVSCGDILLWDEIADMVENLCPEAEP